MDSARRQPSASCADEQRVFGGKRVRNHSQVGVDRLPDDREHGNHARFPPFTDQREHLAQWRVATVEADRFADAQTAAVQQSQNGQIPLAFPVFRR